MNRSQLMEVVMKTDSLLRAGIVGLAVLVAFSGNAKASEIESQNRPCDAFINASSFDWDGIQGRGYSSDAREIWQEETVSFSIIEEGCSFALTVDSHSLSIKGPSSIDIVLGSSPRSSLFDVSSNPVASPFMGSGKAGENVEFPIFVSLAEGQDLIAGEYEASVPIDLFAIENGVSRRLDRSYLNFRIIVSARLSVIADGYTGQSISVDLGDISNGFRKDISLLVESNTPVSLAVTSQNRGRLKHEKADVSIPYRTYLNGEIVDLNSSFFSQAMVMDANFQRNFDFSLEGQKIGADKGVAGSYSDLLTVTFRSEM